MRDRRIIPYDLDVVIGRSEVAPLYELPQWFPWCVYNDRLVDQPPWQDREMRLVVRRNLVAPDGPGYDHRGRRVKSQVDSCAFNGPIARLILNLPKSINGREYWHLDVDLFSDLSDFHDYPAMHEVGELPELAAHSTLRVIRSASSAMPRRLIADTERAFGVPFIEAYGMTEAAPQVASNRLPPYVRKPGSVGRAAGPDVAIMGA